MIVENDVIMPNDADFIVQEARKRQLLVRARSVLLTTYYEKTLDQLNDPCRPRVLKRLMEDITEFLGDGRPL